MYDRPVSGVAATETDAGMRVVSPKVDLEEATCGAYVIYAGFTGNGDHAAFACGDGTLRWLETDAGLETMETVATLGAMPLAGAPDVDGQSILIGTDDGRLVRFGPGGRTDELAVNPGKWVENVCSHPESGLVAFSAGRKVTVLDGAGETRAVFTDHPSTPTGLAFAPDGGRLAVAHYDGVSVWRLGDDGPADDLPWHGSHTAVAWSPDGRFIVTAMQDKEMHCWRMPEKKDMKMSGYPSKIRALTWTADSAYLAASGAASVTSWCCEDDGPTGREPLEFGYVFNGIVTQVAAHPAERSVAGGYDDGTIFIGDIEKGEAITVRLGNGAQVTCLVWSPDGRTLIGGCENGELAVIHTQEGRCH